MEKGISALVATVLLVLITIAAVGIIWGAILPMIKGTMEKSQKCYDVDLEIMKGANTCFNTYDPLYGGGTLQVQVFKGEKSVDISDIQIQVGYAGTTKTVQVNSTVVIFNNNIIPGPNEEVRYTINTSALGMNSVDTASVAAVLKIGNTESICAASPTTPIDTC
jgi:flagellin-like protein